MKISNLLICILVIILLTSSVFISCAPKSQETVILRHVVGPPPGDLMTVEAEEMAQRFNERAGGQYVIKVFPGETLVKTMEALDAVRSGSVEMGTLAWGIYAGTESRFGAMEIPFLFNNVEANAYAQDSLAKLYNDIFEKKLDQKVLTTWSIGMLETISKKPIKTLEDWKGLLLGSTSPTVSAVTEYLGGAAVTVPWTDIYSSLEKGVVDASILAPHFFIMGKLTDVTSYVVYSGISAASYGTTINMNVWNSMPKNIQNILLEEMQQTGRTMNQAHIELFEKDKKELAGLGMDIYVVPNAERERWKGTLTPYADEQIAAMGEFGQKIKQIADEANMKYPY